MFDAASLCEDAKKAALNSGLLNQLRSISSENLAVLTGRRPGNFTDRTNSCMWCVPGSQELAYYILLTSVHTLLHVL